MSSFFKSLVEDAINSMNPTNSYKTRGFELRMNESQVLQAFLESYLKVKLLPFQTTDYKLDSQYPQSLNFLRKELHFMAKCGPDSEIERVMVLYLRQWLADRADGDEFDIIQQYYVQADNKDRYIDFLLVHNLGELSFPIAIECDGGGHRDPVVQRQDRRKDRLLLREYNMITLRFTGRQIYNNPEKCIYRIQNNFDFRKRSKSYRRLEYDRSGY